MASNIRPSARDLPVRASVLCSEIVCMVFEPHYLNQSILTMVSITFFVFVALILVAGFFAATWRRKNRVPLDPDGRVERDTERLSRSNSAFNEPSTGDIKGGIIPTDNKLSQNDFDEEDEAIK